MPNSSKKQKTKRWDRRTDPHADREAKKYSDPIPSRELILELLDNQGEALARDQIYDFLGLTSDEQREALRRRLRAMERDGQIIYTRRGKFAPVNKVDLVAGRIIGHADGFGFLTPDEGGSDLFISSRQMRSLMHGDRALMHVIGVDRRGRQEGALVQVLERNTHNVVGRFFLESGIGVVVVENKRIAHDLLIPPDMQGGANNGQIVIAEIVEQPSKRSQPIGRIIEVMGDHMAPGMEIDIAIRSHDLPCEWPEAVQEKVNKIKPSVPTSAKKDRVDLRDTPLVTIDGADARDFDDAVFCSQTPKGWRLLVAIADVSHYVKPGTELDEEAHLRGNSVYFPGRVIPMLPEILSNGLCSLNPDVDRLCMVCEMYLDKTGKLIRSRFMEAVMRSHARLIYDDVALMLEQKDKTLRKKHHALVPHLEHLYALFKVLRKHRSKRGAIDFDTTETQIQFGENRKIEQIVPLQRNVAHLIIEECMILANVCAARFLKRHKVPTLYRVHKPPEAEKVLEVREFLGELGLTLRGGAIPESRHYAELIRKIKGRVDAHLIQTVLLRSLKQAQYSPENIGHFGLAHPAYLHFTSPIRRYPDLMVHRGIRHMVRGGKANAFARQFPNLIPLGEQCSTTERRADEAARDAVSWLKCEFMLDKVGGEYQGVISAVTSFGVFVELDNIYVEGLVHVTSLANDYFHFDPAGHRLQGERTGIIYRLADRVQVKVVRVDLDDRKIDFELVNHQSSKKKKKGGKSKPDDKKHRSRKKTGRRRGSDKKTGKRAQSKNRSKKQ